MSISVPATRQGPRGVTTITARALQHAATHVVAAACAVEPKHVNAKLVGQQGQLDLRVTTALTVPDIATVLGDPTAVERHGGPLLNRAQAAETVVRERFHDFTGRRLQTLTLHISKPVVEQPRRVT